MSAIRHLSVVIHDSLRPDDQAELRGALQDAYHAAEFRQCRHGHEVEFRVLLFPVLPPHPHVMLSSPDIYSSVGGWPGFRRKPSKQVSRHVVVAHPLWLASAPAADAMTPPRSMHLGCSLEGMAEGPDGRKMPCYHLHTAHRGRGTIVYRLTTPVALDPATRTFVPRTHKQRFVESFPVFLRPVMPAWMSGDVIDLLAARKPDADHVLADALEEAGCRCRPLLDRLRHPPTLPPAA